MYKVLMISNNLDLNGISSVIMNYIRNINLNKLQIDVFAGEPINENFCDELTDLGCVIYKQLDRHEHAFSYYKNLFQVLINNKYDAVHVHTNSCTCIIELAIAKLTCVKKRIAHCHNTQCEHPIVHKLGYPLFSLLYTHGLACSKEAGEFLFKKNNFVVLKNGIDLDKFSFSPLMRDKLRHELGIPKDAYVIGHVGYFNEQKNQMFLVNVLEMLLSHNTNFYLVFVGVGSKQDIVRNRLRELGIINNAFFLNNRYDTNSLYSVFDCFCFPSIFEGFGIAVIEAEANGLPCVVSEKVPKVINLNNEVEFLPLDNIKWVNKILSNFVENRILKSESNRVMIANKGYDIKRIASQLRDIYLE